VKPIDSFSAISFSLSKPLFWAIFVVFALLYAVVSGVLFYHWRKYGMKNSTIVFAEGLFGLVSIGLFITSLLALSSL
jgi:hypothetical protein